MRFSAHKIMKTLKTSIAIALLATTVIFNANAEDKKSETAKANTSTMLNYKMSNLNIGMYEVGNVNSLNLNIALTKDAGKTATIRLMDEKGRVLNQETIGKKLAAYNFRYDFKNMKAGTYFIEVTNGNQIITREIVKGNGTLSY
jgi:hypothetical protein